MNKICLIGFFLFGLASVAIAQTKANLDGGKFLSNKDTTVEIIDCPAGKVQFARGVRWAPADFGVVLTINGSDNVYLPQSCYVQMSCVRYDGASSVMIEDAPACGGNAVGEDYIVIDLISLKKRVLDYRQLKGHVR